MVKYLFIGMVCFNCLTKLSAQTIKFEESVPFVEPDRGWLKVLQMKNGNTALVHITFEDGVNLKIYDALHKIKIDKIVKPKYAGKGELPERTSKVVGVLNVSNDIVLLVSTIKDATPILIRVVIDVNTGAIKAEEEIGRLKKIGFGDRYALQFGVPIPRFEVRKDPDSDNYGIALFNSLVSERSERIELLHYGSNNQLINRSFYNSPNEEFKYMELIDFVVLGDSKLVASAYVYNNGDDKISYLSLASLEKGVPSIKTKQLEFTENKRFSTGLMRFNKKSNLVAIVGLDELGSLKSKTFYNPILTLIDPVSLSIVFTKDISLPNVNDEYHKIFGDKKDYEAVPQDFYVNEDGTYAIVFEESSYRAIYSSNISHTTTTKKLGSIAVAILDDRTKEIASHLIPKGQEIVYVTYGSSTLDPYDYKPMYVSRRHETAQWLKDATQYKSFAYVNGKNGNYILFNDVIENIEKVKNGKLTIVNGVSGTDAFLCTMKGNEMKRDLLFGSPIGKAHNFTMFTVSDYDPATGTYVTMKLENNRGKQLKVIWIKL